MCVEEAGHKVLGGHEIVIILLNAGILQKDWFDDNTQCKEGAY